MSPARSVPGSAITGFGGTVIRPDQPGYDTARAIWNAMHDRRPALIARPRSAPDVAAAIGFARAERSALALVAKFQAVKDVHSFDTLHCGY